MSVKVVRAEASKALFRCKNISTRKAAPFHAIIVGEVRTMKSNPNTKPVAYSRSTLLEPRAKVLEESLKSSTHPQVTSLPFLEKIGSVIGD